MGAPTPAVYAAMEGQKSPKVFTETLKWIETAVCEFGIDAVKVRPVRSAAAASLLSARTLQPRALIGFVRTCLDSSNPDVRKRATAVLVVLRIHIGPGDSPCWGAPCPVADCGPQRSSRCWKTSNLRCSSRSRPSLTRSTGRPLQRPLGPPKVRVSRLPGLAQTL